MKKIITAVCFAVLGLAVNAQKTTFGIKGGLNLSSIGTNDAELKEDKSTLPTFHVGGIMDVSLSNNFSFQPQLLVQGKGVAVGHGGHSDKFKFVSVDLPLNLLYKSNGFFIGGGPNFGVNVDGNLIEEDEKEEIKFGNAAGEYKRANVGLNLMTGYQTRSGFLVGVNYLTDFTSWTNTNTTWRNNLIGISVGYMFGR